MIQWHRNRRIAILLSFHLSLLPVIYSMSWKESAISSIRFRHLEQTKEYSVDTTNDSISGNPLYQEVLRYTFIIWLVAMSAMFSGLTLGFLTLDKTGLGVMTAAGNRPLATEEEKKNAKDAMKILPLRRDTNRLLVTLIVGNVAVNSLLSIFMADLTSGFIGFITSTVLIVIFGEIIPQSICCRHALRVGSTLVPVVKVFMILFYGLAKPISVVLNWALGQDVGTIFSKRELQKLLELHVMQQMLHPEEGHIVRGTLGFKRKEVQHIMVPVQQIYSLSSSLKLNLELMKQIYHSGFTRIPVWGRDVNDVLGIIFVKDLVLIDPEDEVPLSDFVRVFAKAVHRVWADAKLGDVLDVFKRGGVHMALVYDVNNTGPGDPFYECRGMVTLEDIVEEILQDKIGDQAESLEALKERSKNADHLANRTSSWKKTSFMRQNSIDRTLEFNSLGRSLSNEATGDGIVSPYRKSEDIMCV